MFRKFLSIIVLIPFLSPLLASCTGDEIVQPKSRFAKKEVPAISVGELHNEILTNFNKEHHLLKGGKLHVDEFVRIFIESTNKALDANDIINDIDEQFVIKILKYFVELREIGVADFFNPPNDIPKELLNYFVSQKIISETDVAKYIRLFELVKNRSEFEKRDPVQLSLSTSATDDRVRDKIFIDVTRCSFQFWTELFEESSADTTPPPPDGDETFNEKVNYCVFLWWDMSGAIVGGMFGSFIGAAVGTALASMAYIIWGEDQLDDLLDNF